MTFNLGVRLGLLLVTAVAVVPARAQNQTPANAPPPRVSPPKADSMTPGQKAAALNDAFNAGLHALQEKQYDEAITRLEEAAEIDPSQPAVWANLGDAYIGQAGTKTGADFDPLVQKSIAAYLKSIALKPDDAAAHNNYALALARAKRFPEAQAELKTAAELDPATAFVRYYNLGALMSNTGQGKAATAVFKMAIDSAPNNPNNAESYFQYGRSLAEQGGVSADGKPTVPPGTIEALQKYLTLKPGGPNAAAANMILQQLHLP